MTKNVLFLGSSVVAGQFGVDWISLLPKSPNVKHHNFGVNGAQVPGVIEVVQSGNIKIVPSAVVIMVGGNDVSNSIPFTKYSGFEFGRCGRSAPTNSVQFGEEMEELLALVKLKWGDIPIAVFNLKPASEKVDGNLNKIVETFNESLRLVTEKHSNITFLDMYTPMVDLLRLTPPSAMADDISHIVSVERMMEVLVLKWLTLGMYTYNDFGDARGFYMFCDGIHFNERSANVVLEVIKPFLSSLE